MISFYGLVYDPNIDPFAVFKPEEGHTDPLEVMQSLVLDIDEGYPWAVRLREAYKQGDDAEMGKQLRIGIEMHKKLLQEIRE